MSTQRDVRSVITSHRQLEGGGFVVRRPFPSRTLEMVDPFLLLDELGPIDYTPGKAVGAPNHPHRGFETVTYILEGESEHRDSAGHEGRIGAGDVQWMTAGDGVVHAEMPSKRLLKQGGRVHGFQLWVNLPRADKRIAPRYQELPARTIPQATSLDGRAHVRVIAGEAFGARAAIDTRTPIAYLDWTLHKGARVEQPVPANHDGFIYVFKGEALIGPRHRLVRDGQAAVLEKGDALLLGCADDAEQPARLLLLSGVPLHEPVARYGPFVMNTQEELLEAIHDFRAGTLGGGERARSP